jgi:hypothetical protein
MDSETLMRMTESGSVPPPAVDPADLLSVWKLSRNVPSSVAGQQTAIDMELYQNVCRPGADVFAVWYRSSLLGLMAGPMRLLGPWMHGGELDEAAFPVMAVFPMKTPGPGVQEALPLDVAALLKEIEKAAGGPGTN